VILHNCFGFDFYCLVYLNVGSVTDASKRMMLAKAIKDARAAKAGASSTPAADPNPPSTLPLPPPATTEAPLGSSSPSPHSPEALKTPSSPLPIVAVPLAVASSPALMEEGQAQLHKKDKSQDMSIQSQTKSIWG